MRLFLATFATLSLLAGIVWIAYEGHVLLFPLVKELFVRFIWEWIILLVVFTKGFLFRLGLKYIIFRPMTAILPSKRRRFIREKMKLLASSCKERVVWVGAWWVRTSWPTRVLVGVILLPILITTMIFAGSLLGLLAILPFRVRIPQFFLLWGKNRLLPFLARLAAGRGVDLVFPKLKEYVPKLVRYLYTRLWVRTIRAIVKSREKAAEEYIKRRNGNLKRPDSV